MFDHELRCIVKNMEYMNGHLVPTTDSRSTKNRVKVKRDIGGSDVILATYSGLVCLMRYQILVCLMRYQILISFF